jgi:hypothetical protein
MKAGSWRSASLVAASIVAVLASAMTFALEPQGPLKGATPVGNPDLAFPSVGRLLFGFLFTVLLAVGGGYAVKRWWPAVSRRREAMSGIRTVGRASVSAGLRLYIVEVEGSRLLIAEGRHGVSMTLVQSAVPVAREPAS